MFLYAKYLANMTQVSDVAPGPLVSLHTDWVHFALKETVIILVCDFIVVNNSE
jgi:hypothetical protein